MSPLEVGAELEPLTIERVSPDAMKTMAMLLRDPNPIHWDVSVVEELGLGSKPINQGPINVGYLVDLAASAGGGPQSVRKFAARFVGNVFAGDTVRCDGRVVAVDEAAGTADLELSARVGERPVLVGTATVEIAG